MKIDGSMLVSNPADAGPAARALEEAGFDGAFTFEGQHDPFFPLSVGAGTTERIELYTAVAIAFARNPMLCANIGYDLHLQSGGRFILGLGSQIRPHIEKRYSQTWSRPAARMREFVQAIRAIWANWQENEPLKFRGEFYTHTLMAPTFSPGPNPHGLPPIYLAGVGPAMTAVAGEVADGFILHPFHTPESLASVTMPALDEGLARSGRRREDLVISCQTMIATGHTADEVEAAKGGARARISFYGSTPAYRRVLESIGRGAVQEELNALSKQGKWLEMAGLVDDELLERIAIVAPYDEVASRLRERYGDVANRISLESAGIEPSYWKGVIDALH